MNKVKEEKKKKNGMFIAGINRKRVNKKFSSHRHVRKELMDDVRKMVAN